MDTVSVAHLLIKPVSLDYWGTGIPPDGVGSLPKVVDFFGRSRRLEIQCQNGKVSAIHTKKEKRTLDF